MTNTCIMSSPKPESREIRRIFRMVLHRSICKRYFRTRMNIKYSPKKQAGFWAKKNENEEAYKAVKSDILLVLKVFSCLGLPFNDSLPFNKNNISKSIISVASKVTETVLNVIALYFILVGIFLQQIRVSFSMIFIFMMVQILMVSFKFSMCLTRRKIKKCIDDVLELCLDVTPITTTPHSKLIASVVASNIFPAALFVYYLLKSVSDPTIMANRITNVYLFFGNLSDESRRNLFPFVSLLHIVYLLHTFVYPGLSGLLFCVIFSNFSNVLRRFQTNLRLQVTDGSADTQGLLILVKQLDRIVAVYHSIEESLSPSIFLLYSYLLSSQFTLLGIAIMRRHSMKHFDEIAEPIIFSTLFSVHSISLFLAITVSGAKVSNTVQDVRRESNALMRMYCATPRYGLKNSTPVMCLVESLRTDLTFTASGLFRINKQFVLKVIGIFTTYAALIMQFNN